jgi:hypothetical protein
MTVQLPKENPKGTEKCKEKDLQKENDFCENSSNFNWDTFHCKDTIPQSIFLLETPFYNSSKKNKIYGLYGFIEY